MSGYFGKRLFDLTLAGIAAPLWLPALAVLALLVRVKLGSPVLFRQVRPGLDEEPFELVKFRTMTGAVDENGELLPDECRLTAFGRFLRSTSLDELPELLNVVHGQMSLVGPRPLLMEYLPRYSERHRRRHDVRPGITGLAQVSGRNALTWPAKFELDVEYVERCSLGLDLRLLWRTMLAVVRREGISAPEAATAPKFVGYE